MTKDKTPFMNSATQHTSAHRRTLALVGAAAGLALVVATPLMASAHVHVDPGEVTAGSDQTLTFSFSHGCDDSPTTALTVDIPDGVATVTPVVDGVWTITRELGNDGVPTRVTYTAVSPIESGLAASAAMKVLFEEAAANTDVAFPVTQTCVDGETAWIEVAEDGEDAESLEAPAPVVAVGDFVEESGHGHADATAEADDADHADAEATESADASADPVARWLAAGGLVAGIAALAVVLVRGRSRKS